MTRIGFGLQAFGLQPWRLMAALASVPVRAQLGPPKAERHADPVEHDRRAAPAARSAWRCKVILPEGYHTKSNKPRDPKLIPTRADVRPAPSGVAVNEIVFPPSTRSRSSAAPTSRSRCSSASSRSACS